MSTRSWRIIVSITILLVISTWVFSVLAGSGVNLHLFILGFLLVCCLVAGLSLALAKEIFHPRSSSKVAIPDRVACQTQRET